MSNANQGIYYIGECEIYEPMTPETTRIEDKLRKLTSSKPIPDDLTEIVEKIKTNNYVKINKGEILKDKLPTTTEGTLTILKELNSGKFGTAWKILTIPLDKDKIKKIKSKKINLLDLEEKTDIKDIYVYKEIKSLVSDIDIPPEEFNKEVEKFENEIAILQILSEETTDEGNQNIIKLIHGEKYVEKSESKDKLICITDYCKGLNLEESIIYKEDKPIKDYKSYKDYKRVITDVMKGLKYIHNKNIVHGDLFLKNINDHKVKEASGVTYITKILDFGFSLLLETGEIEIIETRNVPAPYPYDYLGLGKVSKKIDFFTLAVSMIHILLKTNEASSMRLTFNYFNFINEKVKDLDKKVIMTFIVLVIDSFGYQFKEIEVNQSEFDTLLVIHDEDPYATPGVDITQKTHKIQKILNNCYNKMQTQTSENIFNDFIDNFMLQVTDGFKSIVDDKIETIVAEEKNSESEIEIIKTILTVCLNLLKANISEKDDTEIYNNIIELCEEKATLEVVAPASKVEANSKKWGRSKAKKVKKKKEGAKKTVQVFNLTGKPNILTTIEAGSYLPFFLQDLTEEIEERSNNKKVQLETNQKEISWKNIEVYRKSGVSSRIKILKTELNKGKQLKNILSENKKTNLFDLADLLKDFYRQFYFRLFSNLKTYQKTYKADEDKIKGYANLIFGKGKDNRIIYNRIFILKHIINVNNICGGNIDSLNHIGMVIGNNLFDIIKKELGLIEKILPTMAFILNNYDEILDNIIFKFKDSNHFKKKLMNLRNELTYGSVKTLSSILSTGRHAEAGNMYADPGEGQNVQVQGGGYKSKKNIKRNKLRNKKNLRSKKNKKNLRSKKNKKNKLRTKKNLKYKK